MSHWYLVADGGGVACAYRCETPREALNRYLEAIGGVDLDAYVEIWEGRFEYERYDGECCH